MKKDTIKKMLQEEPLSTMISCISEDEKGSPKMQLFLKSKYPKVIVPSSIPEERRKGLEEVFYRNPRKAMEEILNYRFLDREITGMYEGSAQLILPTRQYQSFQKCTSFETSDYQVYFNDYAIPIFKNTILKLSERSKQDSFHFLKRRIQSGESRNLHITVSEGFQDTRSRLCMFLKNDGDFSQEPTNALYYYTNLKQDGTIDDDDLSNILRLIDIFVQTYGDFGSIKTGETECIACNQGSLKISGIDKVEEPVQKIYSLRKKEE